MIAGAGDLPVAGAYLDVPGVAVRGTAVPHPVRLGPDVAVVTEVPPGAGLPVRLMGGVLPSLTHHGQGPVRLPGVRPVHVVLPVSREGLGTGPALPVEDPAVVLPDIGSHHPDPGAGLEELDVETGDF